VLHCELNFFSHSSTITTHMADMDNRVTSVIRLYQQSINSKPYIPSTTFGRATLGADGVASKLFIAFLFSDPDVGIEFLKDVELIQSRMMCCKCGGGYCSGCMPKLRIIFGHVDKPAPYFRLYQRHISVWATAGPLDRDCLTQTSKFCGY